MHSFRTARRIARVAGLLAIPFDGKMTLPQREVPFTGKRAS